MALPAGAKIHVWYKVLWNAQEYQLHDHLRVISDTSGLDTADALDAILSYFADTTTVGRPGKVYRDTLPTNAQLDSVYAQEISPVRSAYRTSVINVAGLWGANAVTGNLAGTITFKSPLAGRREISNRHIGPVPSDAQLNGAITTAYRVQLLALGDVLDDVVPLALGTLNLQPIINHPGSEFSDITSFTVSDRVGTMRRRTLRVGI